MSKNSGKMVGDLLVLYFAAQLFASCVLPVAAQLSFSTGWGHGKRSGAPSFNARMMEELEKPRADFLCAPSQNGVALMQIHQITQVCCLLSKTFDVVPYIGYSW